MCQSPVLRTLGQFSDIHPAFTEPSLRWLRFNQDANGFAGAFVTVGRRVLIDEGKFFKAIEKQNRSPEARVGEAA